MMRPELKTFAATDTAFSVVNMLRCDGPPFRIMAPPAGQRTSLEKNRRADTGTIMNGKFLYVENDTCIHDNFWASGR
jgi:hypothetical protein